MEAERVTGIFQRSEESQLLYEFLKTKKKGDIISYAELSRAGTHDVQKRRGPLYTARRVLQRDDRMVLDTIPKVGLKVLSDSEVVGSAPTSLGRVRRAMRRATKRITAVDFEALTNEQKQKHNTNLSVFLVVHHMCKPKSVEKLAPRCEQSKLPVKKVLEAFISGNNNTTTASEE